MIINIRGTSGSGKTAVVRSIMDLYMPPLLIGIGGPGDPGIAPLGAGRRPDGYRLAGGGLPTVYVVGSYENTCGGCDGIKTQDEICDRVREYSRQGHVVMEGLLMSHLFSRYAALATELRPIATIFAFLDTPLDLCLERVRARREARARAAGKEPTPLNPKNTVDKWHDMRHCYSKFIAAGHDARWVPHERAFKAVWGWLTGASE